MNAKRFLSVGHDCAAVSCYNDEENRAAVSLGRREADNQTKKARRPLRMDGRCAGIAPPSAAAPKNKILRRTHLRVTNGVLFGLIG